MTDHIIDAATRVLAAATNATVTVWDALAALADPATAVWAAMGALPLPVALIAASAGIALAEATRQHHHRHRKD